MGNVVFSTTLLNSKRTVNCKCAFDQYLLIRNLRRLISDVCFCCRWYWQQVEVAALVASAPVAVLNRPELCQASLGEILHVVLHPVHHLDCRLLLRHGLDGECDACVESKNLFAHLIEC